jgi:transcriptional regulator with XRE-family HTH domain
MTDSFGEDPRPGPVEARPLSPGAARRRLGAELRLLREEAGLRLEDAGKVLQRSSATMSRMEGGRLVPRLVDVAALLQHYAELLPQASSAETRDRVLRLAADGRRRQWFDPFRDVMTGDMNPDHINRLVEHETDAVDMKAYGPELIPGLLQTPDYARVVADVFFPGRPRPQRDRFVEFRMARQEMLNRSVAPTRFSAVIGESALRRPWGSWPALRTQLRSLMGDLDGARPNVEIRISPLTAAVPAAVGGHFMLLSSGEGGDDLVYLESRSGADYLQAPTDVERFQLYFDSLIESALPPDEARSLIAGIIDSIE